MTERQREYTDEAPDASANEAGEFEAVPDYLKDPAALARRLVAEAERREREGIAMPEMLELSPALEMPPATRRDGTFAELHATDADPKRHAGARSRLEPRVWVGLAVASALLLALIGAGLHFALRPTDPGEQPRPPVVPRTPDEKPPAGSPGEKPEWESCALNLRGAGSRSIDGHVVFSLDAYTHRTRVKTRHSFGWCFQADRRGAQLFYPLRRSEDGWLTGERDGQFDAPRDPMYEYFVVILADENHPELATDTGREVAKWLSQAETDALQKVGRPGAATDAATGILTDALNRLKLKTFEIRAECYLHNPNPRR